MNAKQVFEVNDLWYEGKLSEVREYFESGDSGSEAIAYLRLDSEPERARGSMLSILDLKMVYTDGRTEEIVPRIRRLLDAVENDPILMKYKSTSDLLVHHYATSIGYTKETGTDSGPFEQLWEDLLRVAGLIDPTSRNHAERLLKHLLSSKPAIEPAADVDG